MASKKDDLVTFLLNRFNDGSAESDELMIDGVFVSNISEETALIDLTFYDGALVRIIVGPISYRLVDYHLWTT